MTCTPLTDPLRHLLNLLAGTTGARADSLNRDAIAQARRFGWIYEYQGRGGFDRTRGQPRPVLRAWLLSILRDFASSGLRSQG